MTDEDYMALAVEQARLAEEAGEVPIGAVVVKDAVVLGRGQNRVIRDNDPTAHAEVVALREAGLALANYRLEGCTVYATLEPCAMCAGALIHARIAVLVYAAPDPKAGAAGSVLQVINRPGLNHRMQVTAGVLEQVASDQLKAFFRRRRTETRSDE